MDMINIIPTSTDMTGFIGGSARDNNDHPFLNGYFYVFFGLPADLMTANTTTNREDMQSILTASAEDFTPPGDRTLNMGDIQGQGGLDASFVTGQTINREFTLVYKDYWGAPIFRIHRAWTSFIDPYLGGKNIARHPKAQGSFASKDYKGSCMVVQTKPIIWDATSATNLPEDDGLIIKVDYFDGVQPMTDLKSVYSSSISANTFIKPSVQYKFDGFPLDELDPDTLKLAYALLKGVSAHKVIDQYKNLTTKASL